MLVRTPDARRLASRLRESGATVRPGADGGLMVTGMSGAEVGALAAAHEIVLHELTPRRASLEEAYLELTGDSVEFATSAAGVVS
ncbi:hypothetical protein GCM10027612_66590 [Microbispora bryophytorum subsp. camponoti]